VGVRNRRPTTVSSLILVGKIAAHPTIVPLRAHSDARNSNRFIRLLHGSLDTRGWGSLELSCILPPASRVCRAPRGFPCARNVAATSNCYSGESPFGNAMVKMET
jgi:hypothetical protein